MKPPVSAASPSPKRPPSPKRSAASFRTPAAGKGAWITNPEALLHALASAEEAARKTSCDAPRADEAEVDQPDRTITPAAIPAPLPQMISLPSLRADERLLRPADREVVVIVRRRRAA